MTFLMPPSEAFHILTRAENPWMLTAPRRLWFALFYLFGAWAFEVLVLLHPATGARRAWGAKGWWVQVVHHVGFPTLSLHNLFTGCAVPGVAIACCTELTVLFSSSYWLLKVFGFGEATLLPLRWCMQLSTYVLRGAFVVLLDTYAVTNDQSGVPWLSWIIQLIALVSTNALNFMILWLVQGAVNRRKKNDGDSLAGNAAGVVESAVGLIVRIALWPLGQDAADKLLRSLLLELCAATDVRLAFRSGWPGADEDSAASPRGQTQQAESGSRCRKRSGAASTSAVVEAVAPLSGQAKVDMLKLIRATASECAGFSVEADRPLLDSGMDSKAAVAFSAKLSAQLPGVPLPSTLVFDYPTLAAVAGYAADQTEPKTVVVVSSDSACLPGAVDEALALAGTACGFPGGASSAIKFCQHLDLGTDGVVEVPFQRWELDEYYDPNPDALGKAYPRHGAFIEGAERFGAAFFGISVPEARAMDPQQRLVLETAHAGLHDASREKEGLVGSDVAVIVGQANNDWIQVQSGDIRKINTYTATGTSASISAARVSFVLGLKGPAYVVDTACSSALVALDCAAMNLRRARCNAAVAAASNIMASVATYVSFSKPRMLSPLGRSLAFDASANGYGRGEGAGAMVLDRPTGPAHGMLRGIAVNQDGLSSTMTAPNGPSQQSVVRLALREASATLQEVGLSECHGTGTPLGDPIEVGALQAVHAGRGWQPLLLAAVKSNVGHLEGAAAMPGLLKSVAVMQAATAAASLHFRALNPHVATVPGLQLLFPSERLSLTQQQPLAGFSGLSSFGFGGTNGHAVLAASEQPRAGCPMLPQYPRRPFPWREPSYRLLRRCPEEGCFEVDMTGDLFDVVRHHIVFGSIVVPGVAYVEMALEATRKLFGRDVQLASVAMVFPFVVPERPSGTEPAAKMRFVQRGDSRFEIQSLSSGGKTTQHVEASLVRGVTAPASLEDLKTLRARVAEPVDPVVVYGAIDSVGLYLGPMFRVARQLWRSESSGRSEVLARLQLDPWVPNAGFIVHPALLDGTIHILATASIGKDVSGLKIFGGVGKVTVASSEDFSRLEQYWVHLTVTESTESSQTFDVKVMADDGAVLLTMQDVVFRAVRPEQIQLAIAAQGAAEEDQQRLFEVQWQQPEAVQLASAEGSEKWLVLAEGPLQAQLKSELGEGSHTYSDASHVPLEELPSYKKAVLVLANSGFPSSETALGGLNAALRLLQAAARHRTQEVWMVTCLTQAVQAGDMKGSAVPIHAGLWGLARTFRNECPQVLAICLDLGGAGLAPLKQLLGSAAASALEQELADREGGIFVPRLVDTSSQLQPKATAHFAEDATYIISGGTGALGLIFANWMIERKAGHLLLLSRSGRPPADSCSSFRKLAAASVTVSTVDVGLVDEVCGAVQQLGRSVRGVIHAAGLLSDRLFAELDQTALASVLRSKVDGTLSLHQATQECPLDFFASFSSVATMLGSVGQANYSAANAFVDSFMSFRRANGRPGVSVQWGPWADVGMAARAGTPDTSVGKIPSARGLKVMEAVLECQAGLRCGVLGVARINWKALLSQAPRVPHFLSNFNAAVTVGKPGTSSYSHDDIKALVVSSLQDALGQADFDLSTPLMELGLDSLAGVEFRNRLQAALDGLHLSSTLMFDYPTVPDLVDYIWSQVGPAEEDKGAAGALPVANLSEQLAIAAHSGRFPGSLGNHPGELWQTLTLGLDTTSELPPERWDMEDFFDADPDAPGKTYVKLGHFIPSIEHFDGSFFGVSEAELRGMDPHQWLTLEITYDSFHAAGLTKEVLSGLECGVYVGCATLGGIAPDIPAFGPFTNIGYAYSGLSGRISHCLSLRGPCFTVDTACSSTIVALDCGSQAVRLGRCQCAVASGTNLQLSPAIWVGFSKMRGLAPDGRCKTFDSRADGFARGEGLGAAFVRKATACVSSPAALLCGVATNHDGRAATITAPNGTAQQRVLRTALAERGLSSEAVSCLECHGTGTALGDPVEVGAQRGVFGQSHGEAPLALAALKSNLGHLEGSAGVAGLSKLVLMLQRAEVPPSLWLANLNPNIDLTGFRALMPSELLDWRSAVHCAGASAFGFSGTNGHAILERAAADPDGAPTKQPAYSRHVVRPCNEWLKAIAYVEEWVPEAVASVSPWAGQCLVLGEGALSAALQEALGTVGSTGDEALAAVEAIVWVRPAELGEAEVPGQRLLELLQLLQALHRLLPRAVGHQLLVVTRGSWEPTRPSFDASAALWGLARSARLEMPHVAIKMLDVALTCSTEAVIAAVREALAAEATEVANPAAGRCVPRLAEAREAAVALQLGDATLGARAFAGGAGLVTGGLGGLGLLAARQLAELGAPELVLCSRSGRASADVKALLQRLETFRSTSLRVARCDVASREEVLALLAELTGPGRHLLGVVHAAGVLERCPLAELGGEGLDRTLGPKAAGAWHLHCGAEAKLGHFVLFSSVSATLGLAGGAAYSAANACLDALASWRWASRGDCISVRFGPVAEVGMTASAGSDGQLANLPLKALSPAQVSSSLRLLLSATSSGVLKGELTLARANWAALRAELPVLVPHLSGFAAEHRARAVGQGQETSWALLPLASREEQVLKAIRAAASSMGLALEDEMPLMEAGIDSLSAVEFRSRISREFGTIRLPSTLMFDYPTIKSLAAHIAGQLVPEEPSKALLEERGPAASSHTTASSSSHMIVVAGAACTLPTGSQSLKALAEALAAGVEGISEMPYARWDMETYFDLEAPTGMYVRHAGFMDGAELFDAALFSIGRPEAEVMDPQQRHLLETALTAFTQGGWARPQLMGCSAGVFVGQDKCDWSRMLSEAHAGPFGATGGSASISSNRISYVLGLRGPSCTMDTACSSSLVAADTAAATLRRGRCELAAVCGVNMLLLPQTFIACCQARMLSPGGRCSTFDRSAAGYARGEGCGAQSLAPRVPAIAELRGSALNQDGRSANLTSPNGPAQTAVVRAALAEAVVQAGALCCVEAHGTGTELGDPIEVGALQAALGGGEREQPLAIGAVKTNIGHLEGGAGLAGLLKLAASGVLWLSSPNLHLRELNAHLDEDTRGFQAHFPGELLRPPGVRAASASSVSSFGFGGTNGHVVFHSPQGPESTAPRKRVAAVEFHRQPFPWREARHPLIRKKSTREDGTVVYSCPVDGQLLELLSHHIVHGEVVVPGACYLEMILAGVAEHLGQKNAWQVEGLGFAKPLVLRLVEGHLEEPVQLRLLLWADGRVEVESEVGADQEDSIVATHVEATLVQHTGGWAAHRPLGDRQSFAELRAQCPQEVSTDLMYSFGVRAGLPLQRRFRAVRQVQRGDRRGLARLEMERDGTHLGFLLGPSVIDSSFQALMSLAEADEGIGSLKIPLSIRRLQPTGRQLSIAVWSYFELIDVTEHSSVFRSWLLNDSGETVLFFDHVHLQEVREEHLQQVLRASGRIEAEQQALYSIQWRPMQHESVGDGSECLVFATPSSKEQLDICGGRVVVHEQDLDFASGDAVSGLLQEQNWSTVIFAGGLAPTGDVEVLMMALHLLRNGCSALWLVTCGAQPLASEDTESRVNSAPLHAGLWGLARAARLEDPQRYWACCLDLDPLDDQSFGTALSASLPQLKATRETEVALRARQLCASRLVRSSVPVLSPLRLSLPARGSLTALRPVPQMRRPPVAPGSALLRTRAVGLNFRDVLNVMGLYPGDPGPPGADCAGTVLEVGDSVSHLRPAEAVFGEAPGCLGTYSLGPAALLTQKPQSWTFEEAATMPVIFATVEEALGDLARLRRGERVLIHAAAGGVGLVAVQYAQHVGAEIFATAGSEEKREYLRSLGIKYISNTRSCKQFEEDTRRFLQESGAEGLDVVLNSLSHEDYIPVSLALLRQGGRFMEIGKRGIWSHERMRGERPDVMYEKIATDTMMEHAPWTYNEYLQRLLGRVMDSGLRPIHMHLFSGFENGVAALQFLQRAMNIGKVVISADSRGLCGPSATPVLSGGTGALGVATAQFLVEEGANEVRLISRSGHPPSDVSVRWGWLQRSAATVTVHCCDVSDESAVLALRPLLPAELSCLVHLAGALADGMLPSLTQNSFERSYGPKVHGLHHLCRLPFQQGAPVVLFSSTSALFGSPGQANYSAANAVLDALATHWTARGTWRARCIQWGPWGEAGMAVEKGTVQRAKASGLGALTTAQALTVFGSALCGAETLLGAAHVRWPKFLRTVFGSAPPFLEELAAEARRTVPDDDEGAPGLDRAALAGLSPEERRAAIQDTIHSLAREVVGTEELAVDAPLLDSGMDSLSGVEFRNRLLKGFSGVRLPSSAVFDNPTVAALVHLVDTQLGDATDDAGASREPEPAPRLLVQLSERTTGVPLFLVPGAGMQAGGFQALAELLPVPSYSVAWTKGVLPRPAWPGTLKELAELLLQEIRAVWPSGPYLLAGHSFGATVCLEIATAAELQGLQVGLVALLDPRSLLPVEADTADSLGLEDSLALLSVSMADGGKHAEHLEVLSQLEATSHRAVLQKRLGTAALEMLEHVRETSQWYAGLLVTAEPSSSTTLQAQRVWLCGAETWLQQRELSVSESYAEATVRSFQARAFQADAEVAQRVAAVWGSAIPIRVPGGHFAMLHEPHVAKVALRLCHALVEAGAAEL